MKQNVLYSQIIAGKYKGKKLKLPSLEVTRSSKSRLKESFFNVLQYDIINKLFIEAFAGSGSIGLEAISRGAKRAYFIEIDKDSYKTLVQNCKLIDIYKCQTFYSDTFIQAPILMNSLKNSKDDIVVYIDPPFDFRENMENIYIKVFDMIENIKNDNIFMIIIEHYSNLEVPSVLNRFILQKTKKFGKSSLSYLQLNDTNV